MLTTLLLPLLWSMLTYMLYALLAVVLFLVSKAFLYELSFLYVMKKFTAENKDAVMGKYHLFIGMIKLLYNPAVADILTPFAKELADFSDKKLVVYHMFMFPAFTMAIVLNQPASMKEYLAKEVEYTKKLMDEGIYPLMNLGFEQETGTHGLMHRSVYSEFFLRERISKLKFRMQPILEKKMILLIQQHKIDNLKFTEIDLREFLVVIQLNWLSDIVFGCRQESELDIDLTAPDCAGIRDYDFGHLNLAGLATIPLAHLLESFQLTSLNANLDFPDILCYKLLSKYGLTTKWAKHHLVKKILDNKIMSVYNKRYAEHVFDAGKQDES
jgi:cytochrome P450